MLCVNMVFFVNGSAWRREGEKRGEIVFDTTPLHLTPRSYVQYSLVIHSYLLVLHVALFNISRR